MRTRQAGGLLRHHPGFRSLWSAGAISAFGDRFSLLAVPVIAMSEAGATPGQVALLWTLQLLPGVMLAMPLAAFLVARPERSIMVGCDLARLLLLCALFVLMSQQGLRWWHLVVGVLAIGLATTVFDVCAQGYFPRIVDRRDYAEANSRFAQAGSAADIVGPALGGLLIGFAGAGTALLVDAASFLLSAALLTRIRDEARPPSAADPPVEGGLWHGLRNGVRFVATHPGLRALVAAFALYNLGGAILGALWFPYLFDGLGLSPSVAGALITVGGISALGAALTVGWVTRRAGSRAMLPASLGAIVLGMWFIPLAALGNPVVLLAVYQIVFSSAVIFFGVTAATVRQSITPLDYQGRVYAVVYTMSLLTVPVGGAVASSVAALASPLVAVLVGAVLASISLVTIGALSRTGGG
ncbi:MFS transporter [Actinophytocola sp.]|uniref:MFS transporter n=1 Tax=Actinophytocola sp. TaxID=1872138 RepID=UPI002D7ECBEC|nr:MFS transporter [Actinophytocola sp.]HET9141711.1 MFS transporter [Actinophytocola sp.]